MELPPAPRIRIEELPTLELLSAEEMANIFGAGRPRVPLGIEALETREMMAGNLTASLTGGLLRIEGTPGADQIRILQTNNEISVQGIAIQSSGTSVASVSTTAVQRIVVEALAGDDHVWVGDGNQSLTPILEVASSTGHDLLHSRGTTFATGLADGLLKVIQANGNVASVNQNNWVLSVNGVENKNNIRAIFLSPQGNLVAVGWSADISQSNGATGNNWQMLGYDYGPLTKVFRNDFGFSDTQIARTLYSIPGTSAEAVGVGMWQSGLLSYSGVAQALKGIPGLPYGDIGYVLSRAHATPDQIAQALKSIPGATLVDVSVGLRDTGLFNYASAAQALKSIPGTGLNDIAYALRGANASFDQIAQALKSIPNTALLDVSKAMYRSLGLDAAVNGLKSLPGVTPLDVAAILAVTQNQVDGKVGDMTALLKTIAGTSTGAGGVVEQMVLTRDGNLFTLQGGDNLYRWNGSSWEKNTGWARQLVLSKDGSLFIRRGDNTVHRWNGSVLEEQRTSDGVVQQWVQTNDNTLFTLQGDNLHRWNGTGWEKSTGWARQLVLSNDGNLFIWRGDNTVHRWNGSSLEQQSTADGVVQQWVQNKDGNLFTLQGDKLHRWNGTGWEASNAAAGALKQMVLTKDGDLFTFHGDGIHRWNGSSWERTTGWVQQLVVSNDGSLFVRLGDNVVYRWNGSSLEQQSTNVSVVRFWVQSNDGNLFTFQGDGLSRWNGSSWERTTGWVQQMVVSDDGSLFVRLGDNVVYRWNGSGLEQQSTNVGVVRFWVQIKDGNVFTLQGDGIYRWNGSSWYRTTGWVQQMLLANDSQLFARLGDNTVYHWKNSTWEALVKSKDRSQFVRLDDNIVYRWIGTGLEQQSTADGVVQQMVLTGDGNLFTLQGDKIYRWNGSSWERTTGGAQQIALTNDGNLFNLQGDGLSRWTGSRWEYTTGWVQQMVVSNDGSLFVRLGDNTVYGWNGSSLELQNARVGVVQRWVQTNDGNLFTLQGDGLSRWNGSVWEYTTGWVQQMVVTTDGNLFIRSGDNTVHRWNGSSLEQQRTVDGVLKQWVQTKDGTLFTLQGDNLHRWNGSSWEYTTGWARQTVLSNDGNLFIWRGDNTVHGWNGSSLEEQRTSDGVIQQWVQTNDNTLFTLQGDNLYRWNGSSWERTTGWARQMVLSKDGSLFIWRGDNTVHRWNGSSLEEQRTSDGVVQQWIQTKDNTLFTLQGDNLHRWNGSSWEKSTGWARQTVLSNDGNLFIWRGDNTVHGWNGSSLEEQRTSDGVVQQWVQTNDGNLFTLQGDNLYRWNGSNWELSTGWARQMVLSKDGSQFIWRGDNTVHRWNGSSLEEQSSRVGAVERWVQAQDGNLFTLQGDGLSRWNGSVWEYTTGWVQQLVLANDGSLFVRLGDITVYRWNGSILEEQRTSDGVVQHWVQTKDNTLFTLQGDNLCRWDDSAWQVIGTGVMHVAALSDGRLAVLFDDGMLLSSADYDGSHKALVLEKVPRQFVVSGRERVIDLTTMVSDLGEGVTLTPRIEGDVPYTAKIDIESRKLTLMPTAEFTGDFKVTVTASDGASLVDRPINVTVAGFEELAYQRLLHPYSDGGFRDEDWFIIGRGDDLQQGDAMIFTGLAASMAALRGDDAAVRSLLLALRDKSFDLRTGAMIRHPDVYDYVKNADGVIVCDIHAPVSKDGVLGVMTGAYYAYTAAGMSTETRALAREVMGKYIDYLIAHQWKTIDHYPDHYWAQVDREVKPGEDPKKSFANVFNEKGGGVMWKGPESYMMAPNDVYALQNAAAEMGFVTSHWQPWVGFGVALVQLVGDGAAQVVRDAGDRLANWVGEQFDPFLAALKVHKDYSFHVIPGIDATLVKGSLDLELSEADRRNIVAGVEEAVRGVVQGFLVPLIDDATEVPALANMFHDMLGRVVDKVLDHLPDWLGADRVRPVLTDTLQQVMPWLNGNTFGELIAFRLSHELAKMDEITAHLSFWPTLLMYETRPEMVDLLGPSVQDLDGYLHGLTVDYTNERTEQGEFWDKNLRRMDMLLYAWMDGEQGRVGEWLNKFETDARYENLDYPWKKSHSVNVDKVLAGAEKLGVDPEMRRLDYLLLKQLERHGVPESATQTVGDWLSHWRDVVDGVGNDAIKNLRQGARDAWDAIEQAVQDLADREVANAREYFDGRLRSAGDWLDTHTAEWNAWYNDSVGVWKDWLKESVKDAYTKASDWYGKERDRLVGEWNAWYRSNYDSWHNWLEGAIADTYDDAANWLRQNGGATAGILGQILGGFSLTSANWLSLPDWSGLPRWAQDYINGYIRKFNDEVNGFWAECERGVASVRESYGGLISTLDKHLNSASTDWLALKDWGSLPSWAQKHINGYIGSYNDAVNGFKSELDRGVASVRESYGGLISTLGKHLNSASTNWLALEDWGSLPSWAQKHINGYIGSYNEAVGGFWRDLEDGLGSLRGAYDTAVASFRAELDGTLAHWQGVLDSEILAGRQSLINGWQRRLDAGMGELART